ncbi:MAG: hypothetical protein M0P12_01675 [Paludibacteraceae bacterium]|nr:hypothetical protein [Paludibacteraceae bacterium]
MGQHKRGKFEERKEQAILRTANEEALRKQREEDSKRKAQEWWAGLSEEDRKKEIEKEEKRLEFQKMLSIIMHPPIIFKGI